MTISEADRAVGQSVNYHTGPDAVPVTITGISKDRQYVFIRFRADGNSIAVWPEQLHLIGALT